MGLELVGAFFVGLVWWEIILFGILVLGFLFSLGNETSIGAVAALGVLFVMSWTGVGALYSVVSFSTLIWGGIVYLIIGLFWSFWKWRLLVSRVIRLMTSSDSNRVYDKNEIKREISRRKDYDTIVFWILVWPFSALGYFVNDFIIDMVRKFVEKIYTVYDKIADNMINAAGLKD